MPTLQELDSTQVSHAVREAAQRCVPLAVSVSREGRWINLRSRFVTIADEYILVELPGDEDGYCSHELAPAEKMGLSFKLKHHKHICTVTVTGPDHYALDDGTKVSVLRVCWPTHMHRLQRRAYLRVDVPPNRIVRVSFWLGGTDNEPSGGQPSAQVWSGTATNISAGGVQLKTTHEPTRMLEAGDVVGMHLMFGLGSEAVYADAQFRHVERDGDEVLMGFQFVGLGQTRKTQQVLKVISSKVAEFQRAASR